MKIDPPYKHLVQKPSLCGPTCLQMVLLRRGVWVEQEEIAKKVDARVLKSRMKYYTTKLSLAKNKRDVGIWLRDFETERIKKFLAEHGLSLRIYRISKVKDVKDFVSENIKKGNDVLANFWMKPFRSDANWGHYGLIAEVKDNHVVLCDPYPTNKTFWEAKISDLAKAMRKQFDGKERGFVVIM